MRSSRILALSGLALLVCVFLAACGGGGSKPAPAGAPVITSTVLTQATINVPYGFYLQATGGTGIYTWGISGGSLPPGLSLNDQTALISGTPTAAGNYKFTAKVTDQNNLSGTANLTLVVGGAVIITCNSCATGSPTTLPSGTPGVPYSATVSASGGVAPYTWSGSSLPPGLTINASTGVISGTPTTPGPPAQFTVQATDSEQVPSTGSAQLTLTIMGVTTKSLPNATIDVPYTLGSMTVAGGVLPYTWCVMESNGTCDNGSGGALPVGLSLAAGNCVNSRTPTCTITGTPTQLGVKAFTVQVTDHETPPAVTTQQLSIDVQGPTLQVTTTTLPIGTVSVPYSGVLQATGGIPPLTWCIIEASGACDNGSGGALPAGLTVDASTGVISGTPTATGTSSFTAQVRDSESPPQVVQSPVLSIAINPAVTNGLLHGNFAFALNGYDNGSPFIMAAAFIADGQGNITGGFLDLNDGSGEQIGQNDMVIPQTIEASGSTYNLNANGTGTMTIVTNKPATYQFSIAVSGNACTPNSVDISCGSIIVRDPSNPQMYGSGALEVQDSQDFSVTVFFPGNFALLFSGTDPSGKRYAGAGALGTNSLTLVDIDCSSENGGNGWGLPACPADINDNGQAAYDPIKGSFSTTIDPGTGRGNFVIFTFPDDPEGYCLGTQHSPSCIYAYYIVNEHHMILISADPISKPANLTLWSAVRQQSSATGWNLTSLQGTNVVELNALDPHGGSPVADVTAGLLNGQANGNATFDSDENDGGTLSQQQSSGSFAIDSTGQKTGEVTLSGFNTQFGSTPPILYLYQANHAFVVGTDTKVTSGVLEPQSGAPFSNGSVVNTYAGGSNSPVLTAVTNSVTYLFADGVGDIMATQYTSGSGGPGGPDNLTLTYSVDSTGRAVVKQNGNTYGILYVVSPTKFVLLPAGDAPVLNIFASGESD